MDGAEYVVYLRPASDYERFSSITLGPLKGSDVVLPSVGDLVDVGHGDSSRRYRVASRTFRITRNDDLVDEDGKWVKPLVTRIKIVIRLESAAPDESDTSNMRDLEPSTRANVKPPPIPSAPVS